MLYEFWRFWIPKNDVFDGTGYELSPLHCVLFGVETQNY